MTVARWGPDSITTTGGVPIPNLPITINVHGGGLATLYTDETGSVTAANPTTTDAEGNLQFFAATGDYDIVGNGATITVTLGGSGGGSITLIESLDSSVTVTNGAGPTVNLSVAAGGVTSVFTRTGAVTAQTGDYTASQVGALPSTDDLSAIASANATAGNVSMNSHKITNLTNGASAQDAAAFGQIPTSAGTIGGLLAANNLSDVGSASTSLTNIGGMNRFVPLSAPVTATTHTLAANELATFDTTSNAITATLPNAPIDGTVVGLKLVAPSPAVNTVTYNCAGSDHFNITSGPTTGTLVYTNQAAFYQYKASTAVWFNIGDDIPLSQLDLRYLKLTGGTMSGSIAMGGNEVSGASDIAVSGLTGATTHTRYVGGTASGHPASGTFSTGDFVVDASGVIWICTSGGTPGTWANAGSSSTLVAATGETGATAAVKFVGGTTVGAPTTGTFNTGDYVIDRTGFIWICTSGGTPGTWVQPSVSSLSTALELALTETVYYPPVTPLRGNTALWINQSETFSALGTPTAIAATTTTVATGVGATTVSAINVATTLVLTSSASFTSAGTCGIVTSAGTASLKWTGNNTGTNTLSGVVISGVAGASTVALNAAIGYWSITFNTSILGTLGIVGDTFPCWTQDFLPSGWNVGSPLGILGPMITATVAVTGGGRIITLPETSSPATATQLGSVQADPVQSAFEFFGDTALIEVQGTNSMARSPSNVNGLGPMFQSNMIYQAAAPVTQTFTLNTGSNIASYTGTPNSGIFTGMNVTDLTNPSYLPLGTIVGSVYYTIGTNTTSITFINKYGGTDSPVAQNPVGLGGSSTDNLSFCSDILTGEQMVVGCYGLSNGQSTQVVPNTEYYAGGGNMPGLAQAWGQAYAAGVAWEGDTNGGNHSLTGVQQADFLSGIFVGSNTGVAARIGYSFIDQGNTAIGPVGTQIGYAAGLWYGLAPTLGFAGTNGAALSSLSTLTVIGKNTSSLLGALPSPGSGVIYCSDGMHAFNWAGVSGSTFTGCTYSGSQAATVATGNPIQVNPTFLTGVGGANTVGILNSMPTAFPSQAPTTTVASGSNGITAQLPIASTTFGGTTGTALSALSTMQLTSITGWPTSGTGTVTAGGLRYLFNWTGISGSSLTGCTFTGVQTTTLTNGTSTVSAGVIFANSVEWFPDIAGTLLAINGAGLVQQIAYGGNPATTGGGTNSTYVTGTASATSLTTLAGTLTVNSTSLFPASGTGILMTNDGPLSVSWTGLTATTLTGFTTGAQTVINGSQLFFTSTTVTGLTGLGPAFVGCSALSNVGYGVPTLVTGMTLMSAGLGGNYEGNSLPNGAIICVGPGFQLPPPNGTKMALYARSAATAALGVPTFTGLNPSTDGMEIRIVNAKNASGATITFESNGSSSGTLMSLGAATRAVTVGGSILVGWDVGSGEWIEYSASNLGSHG